MTNERGKRFLCWWYDTSDLYFHHLVSSIIVLLHLCYVQETSFLVWTRLDTNDLCITLQNCSLDMLITWLAAKSLDRFRMLNWYTKICPIIYKTEILIWQWRHNCIKLSFSRLQKSQLIHIWYAVALWSGLIWYNNIVLIPFFLHFFNRWIWKFSCVIRTILLWIYLYLWSISHMKKYFLYHIVWIRIGKSYKNIC